MEQNPNPLADRNFYRVTALSTALALGVMLAFIVSMRDIRRDVSLEFSAATVIWFVIGAVAGWGFWAFVRKRTLKAK